MFVKLQRSVGLTFFGQLGFRWGRRFGIRFGLHIYKDDLFPSYATSKTSS